MKFNFLFVVYAADGQFVTLSFKNFLFQNLLQYSDSRFHHHFNALSLKL